jgi:5-hydroxyisourate hydrolase-like protein (transthyretin family)
MEIIRSSFILFGMSLLWSVALCGCQRDITDKERLELIHGALKDVVPLGGTITIDGEPQQGVIVTLYNEDGTKVVPIRPALTDEDGRYEFATYVAADGVEPGSYRLTFLWRDIVKQKKQSDRFVGPDKLRNLFSDPIKSEFKVTVEEGDPISDLDFDLKTK